VLRKIPAGSAKEWQKLLEEHYSTRNSSRRFLERYKCRPARRAHRVRHLYFRRPGVALGIRSPEKKLFLATERPFGFISSPTTPSRQAPIKESSDWRTPLALLTGKANLPGCAAA